MKQRFADGLMDDPARGPATAMNPRCTLTAWLARSAVEGFAAWSCDRKSIGPNGEPSVTVLLHTRDAGTTWSPVPLRRTWLSHLRLGFPTWPPEAAMELGLVEDRLTLLHRDEWVPFEPGGESLWLSSRGSHGAWSHRWLRYMDYEGSDSPGSLGPTAPPEGFRLPDETEILRARPPAMGAPPRSDPR